MLVGIGYGNSVSSARIITIVAPGSAPVKRMIQVAKDRGMLIDGTHGRKTRSVIITDSDHVVLSANTPETIKDRFGGNAAEEKDTLWK